jgi:hypothetical protein
VKQKPATVTNACTHVTRGKKKGAKLPIFIVEWISNFTLREFQSLTELFINTCASEKIFNRKFMGNLIDLTRVKEWHI